MSTDTFKDLREGTQIFNFILFFFVKTFIAYFYLFSSCKKMRCILQYITFRNSFAWIAYLVFIEVAGFSRGYIVLMKLFGVSSTHFSLDEDCIFLHFFANNSRFSVHFYLRRCLICYSLIDGWLIKRSFYLTGLESTEQMAEMHKNISFIYYNLIYITQNIGSS